MNSAVPPRSSPSAIPGHSGADPDDANRMRLDALSRVLVSKTFANAARLSSFLSHVCMASVEGRASALTEQQIGHEVFGRPAHYNPAEDTIVRSTARLLRKRLAVYYESEGRDDALRIAIPRGAYVPAFGAAPAIVEDCGDAAHETGQDPSAAGTPRGPLEADRNPASANSSPLLVDEQMPATPATGRALKAVMTWLRAHRRRRLVAVLMVTGVGLATATNLSPLAMTGPSRAIGEVFLSGLFSADRDTLLVPADSALVMYQGETHREITLDQYIAKDWAKDPSVIAANEAERPGHSGYRRYTSVTSVMLAAEFGKLSAAAPQRFHVRYARDLQLNDLKRSNAILIGVRQANPWAHLFRNRLNFHIDWHTASERFHIYNDHPQPGEKTVYEYSKDDPAKHGYATIAYVRGLNGGYTLLLGGTTASGTEAAAEFLFNTRRMAPILQQAGMKDGVFGEFEVLLQCVIHADGSTDTEVVGLRTSQSS